MFCALCGDHARHVKSPVADLRRKTCPRFPAGVIHRGCCAQEPCSDVDARGHVRCMWEQGGKERLLEALTARARAGPSAAGSEGRA